MPDMHITVGHIVDNPTFYLGNQFEIVDMDDDGTVHILYDSYGNTDDVPTELLTRNVSYMIASDSRPGTLVIYAEERRL